MAFALIVSSLAIAVMMIHATVVGAKFAAEPAEVSLGASLLQVKSTAGYSSEMVRAGGEPPVFWDVHITNLWTAKSYPQNYPRNAHWGPLFYTRSSVWGPFPLCWVVNDTATRLVTNCKDPFDFLRSVPNCTCSGSINGMDGKATPGIRTLAETGDALLLQQEVKGGKILDGELIPMPQSAIGRSSSSIEHSSSSVGGDVIPIKQSQIGRSSSSFGRSSLSFTVVGICSTWRLELMSRMIPSPDWYAYADITVPCEGDGLVSRMVEGEALVYDAGTDNGATYMSPNAPAFPTEKISNLTAHEGPFKGTSGKVLKIVISQVTGIASYPRSSSSLLSEIVDDLGSN